MEREDVYFERVEQQATRKAYGAGPRSNANTIAENPPSQEAYEARGALDRIHNLIDGIESRIFSTQAVPAGKDAIEAPPEPIAVMLCGIRQRAESAEQRLRSLLERL